MIMAKTKEKIIDTIMNDFSGSEQEAILRSKRTEMDEDYQEHLENRLYRMSENKLKKLLRRIKGASYLKEVV